MTANNPNDPGAEMKARALRATESFDNHDPVLRNQFAQFAAAFAAKEVARATEQRDNALAGLLIHERLLLAISRTAGPTKCWEDEFKASWAIRGKLSSNLAALLARAVEEERMANCKAVCIHCNGTTLWGLDPKPAEYWDAAKAWRHSTDREDMWTICSASAIHERSQVKGEGL